MAKRTPNKLLLELADAIENVGKHKVYYFKTFGFNMAVWDSAHTPVWRDDFEDMSGNGFASVGCIGGWASRLYDTHHNDAMSLADLFKVPLSKFWELTYPSDNVVNYRQVTVPMAVQAVRNLANKGDAGWAGIVKGTPADATFHMEN